MIIYTSLHAYLYKYRRAADDRIVSQLHIVFDFTDRGRYAHVR